MRVPPPGLTKNDCIFGLLSLKLSADHEELGHELGLLNDLYKQILEGYFQSSIVQRRFRSVMGQLLAALQLHPYAHMAWDLLSKIPCLLCCWFKMLNLCSFGSGFLDTGRA